MSIAGSPCCRRPAVIFREPEPALPDVDTRLLRTYPGHHLPPPARKGRRARSLTLGDECRARSLANHLPLRLGDDRENVGDHAAGRRGRVEAKVQGLDLPALVLRGPAAMRAATWTTDLRTQRSVLAAQQAKACVTLASGRQSS